LRYHIRRFVVERITVGMAQEVVQAAGAIPPSRRSALSRLFHLLWRSRRTHA
jgi:hypothetical protein